MSKAELHFDKMKPMVILPPESMSEQDIERLRENGLCVVVAKEPGLVKFLDPIPAVSSRSAVENAAIQLSRKIMAKGFWNSGDTRQLMTATFVDLLIKGTPLDPEPSQEEQERFIFNAAKADELRRLAREEAKAERAAKKQQEAKKTQSK